ncbi:hypothetical protein BN2877_31030 [Achromobacter xylosoxidans]|nr:hypothetical protein BN2877_31030 [Achromobacter xylosoxidans]
MSVRPTYLYHSTPSTYSTHPTDSTYYAFDEARAVPETDLLARARNGDSAVTQVSKWETKTVDIPPGQKAEVFTYGLCGGTAIAVLSKHGDGTRGITLSHYPPLSTDDQLSNLEQALNTTSHCISNPNVQHEIYVITPRDRVQDHEGTWILQPREQAVVARINTAAQALLPEIQPQVLLYSENRTRGESGAFVLSVFRERDKPIRYQGTHYGACGF